MACCKIHKETCAQPAETAAAIEPTDIPVKESQLQLKSNNSSLSERITSSQRLQSFLTENTYISEQLPVLLARIARFESTTTQHHQPASALARDLERNSKISEILKEAIETDPKIGELYSILQDEDII